MRTLLFIAIVSSAALPGCLPLASCGGYDGGGDAVYRRGTESIVLCANGGFSAVLGGASVEGRYVTDAQTARTTATRGDTGAPLFELTANSDGSALAPALGSAAWQLAELDEVELDHADIQCTDLESRPWWTPAQ